MKHFVLKFWGEKKAEGKTDMTVQTEGGSWTTQSTHSTFILCCDSIIIMEIIEDAKWYN